MSGAFYKVTIVTMNSDNTIIDQGGIVWEKGVITFIGAHDQAIEYCRKSGISIIDGKGAIIFPGLINTHMHLYQNLLKGIGADLPLEKWWHHTVKPAGLVLDENYVQCAARGAILESIRCGTTTLVDYFQVHARPCLSQVELDVVSDIGVRFIYARGFRTTGKENGFPAALVEETSKVFHEIETLKRQYGNNDLISIWVAPAGVWAMDEKGLRETADFSIQNQVPCTIHMLETQTDNIVCMERYGLSAMEVFQKTHILNTHLLAVHAVHLTDNELDVCKESGVYISHNPVSNMYMGCGISPVIKMLDKGILVSLASDGAASNNCLNMLDVLKMTALLHKVSAQDPSIISAHKVLQMATRDAAETLGLEHRIGSLEVGKDADLFRYDPLLDGSSTPWHDPIATLVYASSNRSVADVLVKGKFILKNDRFTGIDELNVYRLQQQAAKDLIQKAGYDI